jgi:aminoglycoside phosphotransferase (APT) family kinase protein
VGGETSHLLDVAALGPLFESLRIAVPVGAEYLTGGGAPSWRVDLGDGGAVVIRTFHESAPRTPANEIFVAGLLAGLEVPTKQYLHYDDSGRYLPRPFVITNYLSGRPVRDFVDEPDVDDLLRQMGGLLRRLHAFRLERFGFFDADGPVGPADPDRWLLGYVEAAFREFRTQGADAALSDRLEAHFMAHGRVLRDGHGPVFAHNDFHPGNVLAARDADDRLRLTGLIDYGSAFAAPALFDLAKALFICQHEMPGSNPEILAGYGPIDHPQPSEALRLYLMLHRIVMWGWLRRYGVIAPGEKHDLIRDLEAMAATPR